MKGKKEEFIAMGEGNGGGLGVGGWGGWVSFI